MGCSYPLFVNPSQNPKQKQVYSENFIPIKFTFILYRGHSLGHDSSTDGGTHSEKSDDGGDDVAIGSLNCRRARKTLKYGDDNVIDINPINERNTSRDLSESVEGSVEEYEDLKFLIGTNFNVIFLPDLNESDEEDVNGLVNEILI
ncbi:9678_t:CDS:2 [Entrophospora sp. SA101]|nr:9678_t:CDS:2 [Entrophospora sp. SA101]